MKKLLLLLTLCVSFGFVNGQNVTIKGTVVDTTGNPLAFSSVLLLMPQDSALVTYALANDKGEFIFKNVERQPYLLKATFVSYLPYQELITPQNETVFTVENIALKPLIRELYEVVVKTAKAPISIKGDTVEYDASKFKVPPGSTVEDLLRKLPGVEVLQDGTIQAQGEEVRNVTVDGKRFFGGDPKMATKNLGADAVKKVQVFNGKSEQAKLTGIDDGKREKSMNLELKEEAKKGGFGKVTAGVGTDNRAILNGNYNKFDAKNQFSMVGFGNNVNQTGMSWDDYQDFRGSNAFQWNDDADFGFSGGGNFRYFSFGGDDEGESFSIPIGGNAGDGFSNNAAGGINYNYNHKKTELSSSYFYNQTKQTLDATQSRENFLNNNQSFINNTNSGQLNFSGNHRASLRASKELDSLNTITLIGNGRMSNRDVSLNSFQEFLQNNQITNRTTLENASERFSYAVAGTGIYRRKFQKKKRNLALSATYLGSKSDNEARQNSVNDFLKTTDFNGFIQKINQLNTTNNVANQLKSSVLFLEPIGSKFYWETFYNLSVRSDEVDRKVFDRLDTGDKLNTQLSSLYDNQILYNRIGSGIRYSANGLNLSVGLAAQQFDITGDVYFYTTSQNVAPLVTKINRKFQSVVPNVSMDYSMKNNRYLNFGYSVGVDAPQVRDLQPVIDNSNPLFITQGNPDLLPETNHRIEGSFNQFNPANFTNVFFNLSYTYNLNQIIYNQSIDPTLLITSTKPINISGGESIGSYFSFGFPLKKTKATLNLNGNVNLGKYLSYINDVLNTTKSDNFNFGMRLSLTPIDWFTFYLRSNWGFGNTAYSINTAQNQQILNSTYSGEMNIKLPKNIYFSTNLNYQTYKNERFGFDQKLPIWGASAYKQFGEKKRTEIRLSAYDILNKNQGISQNASQNFVSTRQVETLAQYFLLSFTYNMRGVESNIRKRWF